MALRVPFSFGEQRNAINEMHYMQYRKTICRICKVNGSKFAITGIKKQQDTRKEIIYAFSWCFTNKNCHYKPHKVFNVIVTINLTLFLHTSFWFVLIQKLRNAKFLNINNILQPSDTRTYVRVSWSYSMLMFKSFPLRNF